MRRYEQLVLILGDLAVFYLALAATLYIRGGREMLSEFWDIYALPFSILAMLWIGLFFFFDLYTRKPFRSWTHFFQGFIQTIIASTVLSIMFFYLANVFGITPKTNLALFLILFTVGFIGWRMIVVRRWLLADNQIRTISLREITAEFIPLIDELRAYPFHQLVTDEKNAHTIVVGNELDGFSDISMYGHLLEGREVTDFASYYQNVFLRTPVEVVTPEWIIRSFRDTQKREFEVGKKIFDVLLSISVMIATIPVILIVPLLIKSTSRGPVFYKQTRVGRDGTLFILIKFRTMVQNAEINGVQWAQKNDPRVTRVGKWLRHSHLDEWPQLWNILKGDMSFIGPRPERPEIIETLERQIPFYSLRHTVKPGITGWAQVQYRYGATIDDAKRKLSYDLYYIQYRDLILDMKIIFQTFESLWKGEGRS